MSAFDPLRTFSKRRETPMSAVRVAPLVVTENPRCQADTDPVVVSAIEGAGVFAIKSGGHVSCVEIPDVGYCVFWLIARPIIVESLRRPARACAALTQRAHGTIGIALSDARGRPQDRGS